MADKKKEKPKDPIHPANFHDTMMSRLQDYKRIIRATEAAHHNLLGELFKITDGEYERLDEQHEKYDAKLVEKVRDHIEKTFDVFGDYSTVKKELGKDANKNFFFRKSFEKIYFPHKDDMLRELGSAEDFSESVKNYMNRSQRRVSSDFLEKAVSDVDPKKHGKSLADYVIKQSGADAKKLDRSALERNIQGVAQQYFATEGDLKPKTLYRAAPIYKSGDDKKKKAA